MTTAPTPTADEEAENALLALGSILTWDDWDDRGTLRASAGGGFYRITKAVNEQWYARRVVIMNKAGNCYSSHFPSEKEIKAACERHYATGKWE